MPDKLPSVLIIGGDHHNTLAAIRCFARAKVPFHVILHGNFMTIADIKISSSKYIKNNIDFVPQDESKMLKLLLDNHSDNISVIFPCSDFSAYIIDKHFFSLSCFYILPGFLGKPGLVGRLMDKFEQYKWAKEHNLNVAKTWCFDCRSSAARIPIDMSYPCIIKPQVSAFGDKSDISIAYSQNELIEALTKFSSKNYTNVLLQEFLVKDFEVCAYGAIIRRVDNQIGAYIKKINEYPPGGGGSLTFAQFFQDEKIDYELTKVVRALKNESYAGMYDIEFLIRDNNIILNEINFRHSGNGYALINNGIDAPLIWYYDAIGINKEFQSELKNKEAYHLDEVGHIRQFLTGHISLSRLIIDFYKSSAFACFNIKDLSGSFAFLLPLIKKKLKFKKKCDS